MTSAATGCRRFGCRAVLLLAVLGSAAGTQASDGNELNGIGAIQRGLAGAGVASPRDATWTLLNPAAIVDLEQRFDVYLDLLFIRTKNEPKGFPLASNPFAGEMEDSVFIPIGSFGAIWPLKHGTLGVGVFGMQGNKADFRAPRTPLAFLGNGDRRSEYQVARMPISYGYQFDNGWAFGGSLVPVFTRFRTDSITLQLTEAEGNHDWDKAFGLGFEVAFYKRWEQWSIGATYFSRGWVEDYELYDDDLITWNLDLPQKVQAGIAYRPIPAVELVLDYKWIEWTGTKVFGRKTINGGLAWQDQHIVKAGINWDINEQFSVRAGVAYGEAAVQPEAAYANALTPALSEFHLAGGFSWRINPRHEFHAAFTHVMAEEVTENGEGDIFSVLGRGTEIGYREDDLTLQYTYRF